MGGDRLKITTSREVLALEVYYDGSWTIFSKIGIPSGLSRENSPSVLHQSDRVRDSCFSAASSIHISITNGPASTLLKGVVRWPPRYFPLSLLVAPGLPSPFGLASAAFPFFPSCPSGLFGSCSGCSPGTLGIQGWGQPIGGFALSGSSRSSMAIVKVHSGGRGASVLETVDSRLRTERNWLVRSTRGVGAVAVSNGVETSLSGTIGKWTVEKV
jgi:hypothetical protein